MFIIQIVWPQGIWWKVSNLHLLSSRSSGEVKHSLQLNSCIFWVWLLPHLPKSLPTTTQQDCPSSEQSGQLPLLWDYLITLNHHMTIGNTFQCLFIGSDLFKSSKLIESGYWSNGEVSWLSSADWQTTKKLQALVWSY